MKVILLKDVPKVGQKNDVKEVKDGFALNMLIPKKLAIEATKSSIKNLEQIKERSLESQKIVLGNLEKNISEIKNIEIKVKANEKGHLFAGVGKEEISKHSGIPLQNIILEHPIKELGEHQIEIVVGEKTYKINLKIEALQ